MSVKRVLSYCLFKNHPQHGEYRPYYWCGIPGLVRANAHLFPGWETRIHHDSCIDAELSEQLRRYRDAGLVNCIYVEENSACCRSMLWRTRPLWDPEVEIVMCRDLDSISVYRERQMVEEFIQSGMAAHAINDNPQHTAFMMGGMVGFRTAEARAILDFLPTWDSFVGSSSTLHHPTGGEDQILMDHLMYPRLKRNMLAHRIAGLALGYDDIAKATNTVTDIAIPGVDPKFAKTNEFCIHVGASGFPVPPVVKYFNEHGDPEIMKVIRSCE